MKDFIKEFSEKTGMDISEFMRTVVRYYFLAYFTRQGSYHDIRAKFFNIYPDKKTGKRK
jgi:hypothetical protein